MNRCRSEICLDVVGKAKDPIWIRCDLANDGHMVHRHKVDGVETFWGGTWPRMRQANDDGEPGR